jgi:alanyl-tRNA synthetase
VGVSLASIMRRPSRPDTANVIGEVESLSNRLFRLTLNAYPYNRLVNPHELREAFLTFFEERGHRRVPGAPVVPPGDPTLLFTSAGMVQFKPYFTGQAEPPSRRMVSVQKCFRTSDIESVGDPSHLTFFEMLGNFSVGDYFKAEAIPWAYEFLTQALGLPPERLWPAVFQDDDEAFDLWRKQGFAAERIMRYGEEHNYWFSGDVGPCGPDSEIHYDFGEQFGCGPDCHPAHGHDRFVEIWNLVFMTYYCDGEKREPLPKKNIDTGSGLERVMSVLLHNSASWDKNRLPSVYDTEVFSPLIRRIEQLSGKKYGADEAIDRAIRIVAEHARAVTFLIGDERTPVVPSNEERGYVCRRMLRRAVYFGRRHLGVEKPFMADLANTVVEMMRESYPELERQRQFISEIIAPEESRFDQTLHRGLERLEEIINARDTIWEEFLTWQGAVGNALKSDPDQWGFRLEEPAHRLKGSLIDLWLVISSRPIDVENIPGVETQYTAMDLSDLFDVVREAIGGLRVAGIKAIEESRKLSGKHRLAHVERVMVPTRKEFDRADRQFESEVERVRKTITGREAFRLHDTYGFPVELTKDIAAERGFAVDIAGFEVEMVTQRDRSRVDATMKAQAATASVHALQAAFQVENYGVNFVGFSRLNSRSTVVALRDITTDSLAGGTSIVWAPSKVELTIDVTPFYPEGGGQVGDRGEIFNRQGRIAVEDTQRIDERLIVHRGCVVEGTVSLGERVTARVDPVHRANTRRNHTATHLLHAAARRVLGSNVRQAGSLVAPDRLRFDFNYSRSVSPEELDEIESLVNEKVRQDVPVRVHEKGYEEAISDGALAFFGDRYGDLVRVVEVNSSVPRFSAELCGGTHCKRTGEIGIVIITSESSTGSGVRRIEALTGVGAEKYIRDLRSDYDLAAKSLRVQTHKLSVGVDAVLVKSDAQRKKIEKLERSLASAPKIGDLAAQAVDVNGVRVLATRVDAPSVDALRFMGDSLRKSLPSGVAVLGSVIDDKPMFIALVTKDIVERGVHAGNLLKRVAAVAGGSAGGRPDMAQGGGKDVAKLDEALAVVPDAVREMLGG